MCPEYFYPSLFEFSWCFPNALNYELRYDFNEIDMINLQFYKSSWIHNLLSWPEEWFMQPGITTPSLGTASGNNWIDSVPNGEGGGQGYVRRTIHPSVHHAPRTTITTVPSRFLNTVSEELNTNRISCLVIKSFLNVFRKHRLRSETTKAITFDVICWLQYYLKVSQFSTDVRKSLQNSTSPHVQHATALAVLANVLYFL